MTDSKQTIATYEAISTITKKMLAAAQNSDWEQLITLEKECRKLAEQLARNNPEPILSDELQQRKVQIIRQILADDAQIRAITEPWMTKLQDMLNTTEHKRNLNQAYKSE